VIVLVGFMGAGKTTIGTLLAARLELPFADSDQVVEQHAGRPIPQIFAEDGEPAFRALEHQVIAGLLEGPDMIIALGGGATEHPRTQDMLGRGAHVVYLQVSYDQALQRVGQDAGRPMLARPMLARPMLARPMLARPDLAAIYERRRLIYARLATLAVGTDDRHPGTVGEDIMGRLAGLPAAPSPQAAP
jgi:shikimate kinase